MPLSELHKKKRARNYMVLGAILCWVALIAAVTIVKMDKPSTNADAPAEITAPE